MESPPLFTLESISVRWDGHTILNDISLSVAEGDFLAVMGPSGAGKSTLLRLFNGLDSPTSGSVHYQDEPLLNRPMHILRKQVGMVFQTPVVVEGSVQENLTLIRRWEHPEPDLSTDVLKTVLERVGLKNVKLDQHAKTLSGGEKQRLALARVLLNKPRVLLLDEPTANLDPQSARKVVELAHELYTTLNITVILVSHDHDLCGKYANRIAFLIAGSVVEEGPPSLLKGPRSDSAKAFLEGRLE